VVKSLALIVAGVVVVSACIKLAATRRRNARLTTIPNTEQFHWSATVQTADQPWILPAITFGPSNMAAQ
jgi:hypothetical protein